MNLFLLRYKLQSLQKKIFSEKTLKFCILIGFVFILISRSPPPDFSKSVYEGLVQNSENPFALADGNDNGGGFAASGIAVFGRFFSHYLFGAKFFITDQVGYYITLWLFLITAFLFLLPKSPIQVYVGSILALLILVFEIADQKMEDMCFPARHAVAWQTIIWANFLSVYFTTRRKDRLFILYVFGVGLITGILPFLRQEARPISLFTGFFTIFFISLLAVVLLPCFKNKTEKYNAYFQGIFKPSIKMMLCIVLILLVNHSIQELFRFSLSVAYKKPYKDTLLIEHGKGLPLYVGLGYAPNPYNISWEDLVGYKHSVLYDYQGIEYDDKLLKMWKKVLLEEPSLFLVNAAYKLSFIHNFLIKQRVDRSEYYVFPADVKVSVIFTFLYFCFYPILFFAIYIIFQKKKLELLVLLVGFLFLALGGTAGAIFAYPGYLSGIYGILVSFALIFLPGFLSTVSQDEPFYGYLKSADFYRVLKPLLVILVFVVLFVFLVIVTLYLKNKSIAEKFSKMDPSLEISRLEFRYGHLFNRMSEDNQKKIINELHKSNSVNIQKMRTKTFGNDDIFKPELLIFTKNQFHLIGYFSSKWTKPVQEWDQGHINSFLIVSKDGYEAKTPTDMLLQSYYSSTKTHLLFYINDYEWKNQYKMYSLPLPENFEKAKFYKVSAVKVKTVDAINFSNPLKEFDPMSIDIFEKQKGEN